MENTIASASPLAAFTARSRMESSTPYRGAQTAVMDDQNQAGRPILNTLQECRDVDHYEKINRISEGTYGVVYRYIKCLMQIFFASLLKCC